MSYKKFYTLSLAVILLVSAYPIHMGVTVIWDNIQNGGVDVTNYPKYIIPYTPISIAIIVSVALLPLIFKLCKKFTLPCASALGVALFFLTEIGFEKVVVFEKSISTDIESWQMFLCVATPRVVETIESQVIETIGNPLIGQYSPAFKIHFYIIALVIILAVINVIYGYSKMIKDKVYDKKIPLAAQLISVLIFVALCILACFTAFFRNGTLNISALSAILMSIFFVVFGITVGVYFGCIFYGKKKFYSIAIPAIMAALTTMVMYVGELILMGGVLFKYGNGVLFEPLGFMPFALIDLVIIFLSGVITFVIQNLINKSSQGEVKN